MAIQRAELESRLNALRAKQEVLEGAAGRESSAGNDENLLQVRREIQAAEAQLRQLHSRREAMDDPRRRQAVERPGLGSMEEIERKVRHLRIAAENLRAAGMNDLAQSASQRADALQRQMREMTERRQIQPFAGSGGDRDEIEALRRELQQLREEVRRLRAERGPAAPTAPRPPQPERQY